ncbi:MAG: metallophosphoesterase, partial [Paracoccus sp. (in: a-proteobacteria)]|nr:metallophosphoesterase [Paracoccus sp. (in: a-proteobacteria)]
RIVMRILITSDLHFDIWAADNKSPLDLAQPGTFDDLDALIIAGDISNSPKTGWKPALRELARHVPADRIHVFPGNHDYYGHVLDGDDRLRDIAAAEGVNFAQQRVIRVGDARFICCTLWTDFLFDGSLSAGMRMAESNMSDYRRIRLAARDYSPIRALDVAAVHHRHKTWIIEKLEEHWSGPTYVVTHHCPHPLLLGYRQQYAAAYASDLRPIMSRYQPDGWYFGHTHCRITARVGKTRVVNISVGYPFEEQFGSSFNGAIVLSPKAL